MAQKVQKQGKSITLHSGALTIIPTCKCATIYSCTPLNVGIRFQGLWLMLHCVLDIPCFCTFSIIPTSLLIILVVFFVVFCIFMECKLRYTELPQLHAGQQCRDVYIYIV